ncbi:uncharacterized protein ASPGLDRAFT_45323 [Aspergillus glaucus CBS 516.65]|uniref:Amino acid transporter transmembrane domain-containing protein n=1 Tax=Aspergillus glaucus CBS 516.65 TaxID=1160497 RepID=A0A1L9VQU2_ASPGL|nr:hypothetical protein ASPGLDRAFT_45323 [Aspergillus glaucus CBS 516.65]OJJ86277.1 hypothetical protein ASPGLDRAFT_45323 [Aspergillus glaucus CBS 516.65]
MVLQGVAPPEPIESKQVTSDKYDADLEENDLKPVQPVDNHYVDPFATDEASAVKYKSLKWWQCGMFMIAESVSLGVLSLPATLAAIGLVPAVLIIVGLGIIALYTGYTIGQFRARYPHIHNLADAGEIIMGRFGRELFGFGQLLFSIFIMGSHIVTFTTMMNTITDHGTCSIVFGIVGMLICMVLSLPRTIKNMTYVSIASFISIFTAVLITMISVGVQFKGGDINITTETNLYHSFTAVTNIVFAYCAHVAFFGLIAEMEKPQDFPKALCMLQIFEICLYVIAAVVIYYFVGNDVASPALGSAGPVMKKVAYGIAIPTIIGAGVVNGHVGLKYLYVRIWRKNPQRMGGRDLVSVGSWVAIGLTCWIIAWIIAEGIPSFSNLLSLISALFASWFSFGLGGVYWLHLNWGQYFSSPRKIVLTIINVLIVGIGATICGLGLYVSGKAIHDDSSKASFTCANNA